jgi:hypothetical protein
MISVFWVKIGMSAFIGTTVLLAHIMRAWPFHMYKKGQLRVVATIFQFKVCKQQNHSCYTQPI